MNASTDWRHRPQAVRRTVSERELHQLREDLRGRWFALGVITTSLVFGVAYFLAPILGGMLQ